MDYYGTTDLTKATELSSPRILSLFSRGKLAGERDPYSNKWVMTLRQFTNNIKIIKNSKALKTCDSNLKKLNTDELQKELLSNLRQIGALTAKRKKILMEIEKRRK